LLIGVSLSVCINLKNIQQLRPPNNGHFLGDDLKMSSEGHLVILGGDSTNKATAFFYRYTPAKSPSLGSFRYYTSVTSKDSVTPGNGKIALLNNRAMVCRTIVQYSNETDSWVKTFTLNVEVDGICPYVALGNGNLAFLAPYGGNILYTFAEDNEKWNLINQLPLPTQMRLQYDWSWNPSLSSVFIPGYIWHNTPQDSAEFVLQYQMPSYTALNVSKPNPGITWAFGQKVAEDNTLMLVTFSGYKAQHNGAYLYTYDPGLESWVMAGNVSSPYGNGDGYGLGAAISNQLMLMAVGAPYTQPSPSPILYIYQIGGGGMTLVNSYFEPGSDAFGNSCAFFTDSTNNLNYLVVGAPFTLPQDSVGPQGAVYVYNF